MVAKFYDIVEERRPLLPKAGMSVGILREGGKGDWVDIQPQNNYVRGLTLIS